MTILLRLLGFLRPYRGRVALTALAAAGVMACAITLPYLTGRVIDDVLGDGDRDALAPLVWALVLLALVRMGFAMLRRWISGQLSLAVEYDLRARLFAHLQRLSFAYFDRMPVGQLMSRATSDLQTVRFFLGYGLIFFFMQAFTLIIITVVLLILDWSLALLALAMGPALLAVAWRYSRRSNPVLIDVQQRVGEVTEMAEESAVGIRVIKAFGRESDRTERFGATARRAFDRSMDAAHLRALYQPLMGFLPVLGLGVVLVYGGVQVIDGAMTLGEFVAFYLYLTLLHGPLPLAGDADRPGPAGDRRRHADLRGARHRGGRARRARGDAPMPAGDGAIRFDGVSFAYEPGRPARPRRHRPRHPGRALGRDHRADRLRQDHAHPAHPALLRRHRRAACWWTAPTCAACASTSCAAEVGRGVAGPLPVLHHASARTSPTGGPRPPTRRCAARPAWPRPRSSSTRCRRASTPSWASAATRSRAASASAWRSRARSSPTRAS